jgi:Ca2+-binding RTX toxin-like protein
LKPYLVPGGKQRRAINATDQTDGEPKVYCTPYFVFDSAVPDYQSLLSGLPDDARVLVLSPQHDGLAQIADALAGERDLASLHIVSHGSDGALYLGSSLVNEASLGGSAAALARIGVALGEGTDILLYGCNVAATETGERFIAALADATGASLAASRNLTGAGGDWELSATVGHVLSKVAIDATVRAEYPHALSKFTFSLTSGNAPLTTTIDGVTASATNSDGDGIFVSSGFLDPTVRQQGDSYTLAFNSSIAITQFQLGEFTNLSAGANYVFTPNVGTAITIADNSGSIVGAIATLTPGDWTNVTSLTISYAGVDDWRLGIDNIEFTLSNDAPVLTGTPADDVVTEDVAAAIDLSAYTLSDADGDSITLTLRVDRGSIASTDGNGVTSGVTVANSGTASMTLRGTAANLNTYLSDTSVIEYTTASNDTTTATLTVTPNDGKIHGTADTLSLSVTGVNDAPGFTVAPPSDETVNEDQSGNLDLSSATFGDIDSSSVTVTLSVDTGAFGTPEDGAAVGGGVTETLVNATMVTLVGAPGDIDSYLNTASNITYTGPAEVNGDNVAVVTISANDGDGSGDVTLATFNIDIFAVNDAPVLENLYGDNSSSVAVGGGGQDVTALNDAAVTNIDSSDYSGGGELVISQSSGTANGSWGVDGTTVTSGGDAIISAGETIQVGGLTVGTVDVGSDGQAGLPLSISFTTTDATSAAVETLLQSLTYSAPSGIGVRSFDLTLADGDGSANGGDYDVSGSFDIQVTSAPPVIANLDGDSVTFDEGDSATLIDVGGDLTVTDVDSADFDGGTLTISYESGMLAEDRIVIDTSGNVSLSAGLADASVVSVGGFSIGTIDATVTGGAGEDLVINLSSNATAARVQTLLRAIQYDNAATGSPTDGNRVLGVTLVEADGASSNLASVTINVDPTPAPTPTPTPAPADPITRLLGQNQDDDALIGAGGNDTLGGGTGNDSVQGEDGDDIIYGNLGADTISGDGGDDQLYGGTGNDFISGGAGNDTIYGGTGNNGAFGGAGNDTIIARGGNDRLGGGDNNDSIRAGAGDDSLFGGVGTDKLAGGTGDDWVFGGTGNDRGFGEAGDDSLFGGTGNDAIGGGAGNDVLNGEDGNDTLWGGAGEDRLEGGAGSDTLYGGEGADTLNGGGADDLLFGGAGSDIFIFASAGGSDEIVDFDAAVDTLDLSDFGFDDLADALGSAAQSGDDLVFSLGGGDSLLLRDVVLTDLTGTNLLF